MKYHWESDLNGYYNFCYDDEGNYCYYIQEVATCFDKLSEGERKKFFKDAKYVWHGTGTHNNPLKADNIEDAKTEFEKWYGEMLHKQVKNLNEEKERAINIALEFDLYMQKKQNKDVMECNAHT